MRSDVKTSTSAKCVSSKPPTQIVPSFFFFFFFLVKAGSFFKKEDPVVFLALLGDVFRLIKKMGLTIPAQNHAEANRFMETSRNCQKTFSPTTNLPKIGVSAFIKNLRYTFLLQQDQSVKCSKSSKMRISGTKTDFNSYFFTWWSLQVHVIF